MLSARFHDDKDVVLDGVVILTLSHSKTLFYNVVYNYDVANLPSHAAQSVTKLQNMNLTIFFQESKLILNKNK